MVNPLALRFIEQDDEQGEAGGAHHHHPTQGHVKPAKVVSPPKLHCFYHMDTNVLHFPWDFGGFEDNVCLKFELNCAAEPVGKKQQVASDP